MKPTRQKTGFTIIELLTVLSVIMVIIAMLVPSLNAIRRYSKDVTQKNQLYNIGKGLELFSIDFDGYPDSSALDPGGDDYCGAMKLCEALVGRDGYGFHPKSIFDDMGFVGATELYFCTPTKACPDTSIPEDELNLRARKKYLDVDIQRAPIGKLSVMGGDADFDPCCPVLCDVYARNELRNGGTKLGMPVLYFKADQSKLTHDADDGVNDGTNIYNYLDNDILLKIQVPAGGGNDHPLYDSTGKGTMFYKITTNPKDTTQIGGTKYAQPYNKTSYILMSAGWDGLYGTGDDIYNYFKE